MLKLNDLLRLSDTELENTKIRFNQSNGEDNYWKEVLDTRKHGYNRN